MLAKQLEIVGPSHLQEIILLIQLVTVTVMHAAQLAQKKHVSKVPYDCEPPLRSQSERHHDDLLEAQET